MTAVTVEPVVNTITVAPGPTVLVVEPPVIQVVEVSAPTVTETETVVQVVEVAGSTVLVQDTAIQHVETAGPTVLVVEPPVIQVVEVSAPSVLETETVVTVVEVAGPTVLVQETVIQHVETPAPTVVVESTTIQIVELTPPTVLVQANVIQIVEVSPGVPNPYALTADFVVDPSGAGTHLTLQAALDDVPDSDDDDRLTTIFLVPGFGKETTPEDVVLHSGGVVRRAVIFTGASARFNDDYFSAMMGAVTQGDDASDEGFDLIAFQHVQFLGLTIGDAAGLNLYMDAAAMDVELVANPTNTNQLQIYAFDSIIDVIDAQGMDLRNSTFRGVDFANGGVKVKKALTVRFENCPRLGFIHATHDVVDLSVVGAQIIAEPICDLGDDYSAFLQLGGPECERIQNVMIDALSVLLGAGSGEPDISRAVCWVRNPLGVAGSTSGITIKSLVATSDAQNYAGLVATDCAEPPSNCVVNLNAVYDPAIQTAVKGATGEFDNSQFGPSAPNDLDFTGVTGTNNKIWQAQT